MYYRSWFRITPAFLVAGLVAAPVLALAGALQPPARAAFQQPPGGFKGIPPEFIKGKVTKVDAEEKKLTIELSKKGDLKVGQYVMVMSKGQPPTFRGKLKITEVTEKEAFAKLETAPTGKGAPQVGDQVVAMPTGPVGPGPIGFPAGKGTKATVKSFDKDKQTVVITVAADSGLKAGQTYMAMKPGTPPKMYGMIKVKEASGKEATCEVMKLPIPGAPAGVLEANLEINLMALPPGFKIPGGPLPPPKKDE
jgi:hypothetical protein